MSKAKSVLMAISDAVVCEGNCDKRFLALPNIHENAMKDATRMFIIVHYCIMALLLYMNSEFACMESWLSYLYSLLLCFILSSRDWHCGQSRHY